MSAVELLLLLLLGQLAWSSVPSGWGRLQQLLSSKGFEELLRVSARTDVDQSEVGVVRLPNVSAVDDDDVDDEEADEEEDEDKDDKDGR